MKVIKWLDENIEEVLLVILFMLIAVIMLAQIIARYIFGDALSWSDELARYLFVWAGFLSVSYCVKKRISIKIDQFQNMASKEAIPWIKMIRHTIVFIFCLIMIPYSYKLVAFSIDLGATSSAMQIPMWWIQSAPLVGFILLAIRVAEAWLAEFRLSRRYMIETIKEELRAETLEELKRKEREEEEARR